MSVADFLVEIGTEELPPVALAKLSSAFTFGICEGLDEKGLSYNADVKSFATPRRLAVLIKDLELQQQDKQVEKLGPAVAAAFGDDGKPTKAAEGFARSNNTSVEQLETVASGKGDRLCYRSIEKGSATENLLEDIIKHSLEKLPIPKRMRWGTSRAEFVRPVHWALVLLGDKTVKCQLLGKQASNQTFGHRFHSPGAITIEKPEQYEAKLLTEGQVIADFAARREQIVQQVKQLSLSINGIAVIEDELLEEVTALVEKPVALCGKFDEAFLAVPQEALVYSMSEHQKYFHIVDNDGQLLPNFITISNIESQAPEQIIEGNEKVIRPRLADAAFFFEADKKTSLAAMRDRLKPIVFQKELGTVFEKTERIAELAAQVAATLGADTGLAKQAGELCKADLASDMVLEFDKMQGTAGYYYAVNEGLDASVCGAVKTHYWPRYAGDKVPNEPVACAVAIADRLDTLTGIFGIGQEPTGSKDPFALRRAAIGLLQIILQNGLVLDLQQLVEGALALHKKISPPAGTADKIVDYLFDRFAAFYQEQGLATEVFLSVRARGGSDALDFDTRIKAVDAFTRTPECSSLAAANKRVGNILEKSSGDTASLAFDANLLQDEAEKQLANALENREKLCQPLFAAGKYQQGLLALTELKPAIDAFFDQVMVNADNEALRENRLALLSRLRELFLHVADISELAPTKQ